MEPRDAPVTRIYVQTGQRTVACLCDHQTNSDKPNNRREQSALGLCFRRASLLETEILVALLVNIVYGV